MVDYSVIAKAEVLSEKAHHILAKYARYTNYDEEGTPEAIIEIENSLALLSKKVITCKSDDDINRILKSLIIYENIIDNIQTLSSKGAVVV